MSTSIMDRLERLPVPILPTFVGFATLSNAFAGLGFTLVRHITMLSSTIVLLLYIVKIFRYPSVCKAEYKAVVPSSLYAGFTMLLMILGSYYFKWFPEISKFVWFVGIILHALHIVIFTIRNVISKRDIETFLPSWFVTYNGILVACVVGGAMGENLILQGIAYYGIIIYAILIVFLLWRLICHKYKENFLHTMAIVLAPCSLCVVAYINTVKNPNATLLYVLYGCVLISVLYFMYMIPRFFSVPFSPGFAGLTFPMAIGIVASTKMAGFLTAQGNVNLANIVTQISGIQIFVTTAVISFVVFNFIRLIKPKEC